MQGFIENRAEGYKCVGCWKVYGDEEYAKQQFLRYQNCTDCYCSVSYTHLAFEEPVYPVANAVSSADVWIEFAYYCVMHSPCFQKAIGNGARYTSVSYTHLQLRCDYSKLLVVGDLR